MVTVTVPGVPAGVATPAMVVGTDCAPKGCVCPGIGVAAGAPNKGVIEGGSCLGVARAPAGVTDGCNTDDAGTCCARLHASNKRDAQRRITGILRFLMRKIVLAKAPFCYGRR